MRKTVTILCIVFATLTVFGQSVTTSSKQVVGKKVINGKEIVGTKYEFSDKIYNCIRDTATNRLFVELRGVNGKYYKNNGCISVFDLNTKKVLWFKTLNYATQEVEMYENVLFITSGKKIERINMNTGETMWITNCRLLATLPNLNISLGTKYNAFIGKYENLKAINLNTGQISWEREIDYNYGINGVMNLNDTAIIFKAAGLHQMNLKNGRGWDYNAVTGAFDYGKTIGANVAGLALGLLTGAFVTSTGHDLVSNINSDIASDSLNYYFASKEYLVALNHNGNVVWKTKLPTGTSSSTLFYKKDTIYMINFGEAKYNGRTADYGKSYLAAYDKKTGNQLFMNIRNESKNPVIEYLLSKDTVEIYYRKGAAKYSLLNGALNKEVSFDEKETGYLKYTAGRNSIYLKSDSTYTNLFKLNPKSMFFVSTKNNIIQLNKNLEITKTIEPESLYLKKMGTEKYNYLYLDKCISIIDKNNSKIGDLYIGKQLFKMGSKIYGIEDNCITEIESENEFQ
jgi:hypothetical protein